MKKKQAKPQQRPVIEWVFGAVSAVVVVALIGFLGYQALSGGDHPAQLTVSIERIVPLDQGTMVAVAVVNQGGNAASAVTVHALARAASGGPLLKQIEFDHIAAHAVRRGAFLFPEPVTADDLHLEVGGYVEP